MLQVTYALLVSSNFANENLNLDFSVGGRSSIPNDFFIALEFQRQGYIEIHKGKKYIETVAVFVA